MQDASQILKNLQEKGLMRSDTAEIVKEQVAEHLKNQNEKKQSKIDRLESDLLKSGKEIFDQETLRSLSFF